MLAGISLFPAYAGVILAKNNQNKQMTAFSRVCGGDPLKGANLEDADLLFPAYAGVIYTKHVMG